jgi:hypothetical protein
MVEEQAKEAQALEAFEALKQSIQNLKNTFGGALDQIPAELASVPEGFIEQVFGSIYPQTTDHARKLLSCLSPEKLAELKSGMDEIRPILPVLRIILTYIGKFMEELDAVLSEEQ